MANHKSADKRTRQDKTKTEVNRRVMTAVRTFEKKTEAAIKEGNKEEAQKLFRIFERGMDRAAKKRIVHRNHASRKISRMSKHLDRIGA